MFQKNKFWKKSADDIKSMKNYPEFKEYRLSMAQKSKSKQIATV